MSLQLRKNTQTYHVRHETRFHYSVPATSSIHLLKLKPQTLPSQECMDFEMVVLPKGGSVREYRDYFGNHCHFLELGEIHSEFSVRSHSAVSVRLPYCPDLSETPAWNMVRRQILRGAVTGDGRPEEFVVPSSMVKVAPAIKEFSLNFFRPGRGILDAAMALNSYIYEHFEFDPTATELSTPVEEVLRIKRGVCQDFAHLAIACFRSLDLPARYISGYIETEAPPGHRKLMGVDASHAWFAFFCPGIGWIELDPTNGCIPSMRHIKIGYGRDYADVSPVSGILIGGGARTMEVLVDVEAVA